MNVFFSKAIKRLRLGSGLVYLPFFLSICSLFFLMHKLRSFPFTLLLQSFSRFTLDVVFGLLFFMLLNWTLEGIKWKLSLQTNQDIGLKKAVGEVCLGVALGFFTPARLGELAGRSVFSPNKKTAIALAGLNSLAQASTTFVFGLAGSVYFVWLFGRAFWATANLAVGVSVCLLVLFVLAFWVFMPKYKAWFSKNKRLYLVLQALSVCRYLVFVLQFWLLFDTLGERLGFLPCVSAVGVYYLASSVIPVLSFAELGLKALTASFVFPFVGVDMAFAVQAAVMVWCINMALPLLIGNYLLLRPVLYRLGVWLRK